jgi:hypothetical protein
MAAKIIFPLPPEVIELRRVVGDAENLHGKVDVVQAKTDNLPADTASVLSTIDTEVGNIQTDVTAIKAKTDNLPADTATALTTIDTEVGNLQTDVTAIKAKTDNLPADLATILGTPVTSVSADIAAVKTVVDAVKTKTDNLPADTATAISTIDTEVGNIQTDVTAIKAKTDNLPTDTASVLTTIDTVVDGIQSDLDNGTDGLGALKALIDSVQSTVDGIQNNTRFTTNLPQQVRIPASGSAYTKVFINIFDSAGNNEDPDSNEVALILTQPDGTDVTTRLFQDGDGTDTALATGSVIYTSNKVIPRDSLGRYYFFLKTTDAATDELLNLQVKYTENAVELTQDRSVFITQLVNDATAANQTTILNNLATVDTVVDAIKVKTDNLPADTATVLSTIDTEVGLIQSDVTAIKAKTDNLPANTATELDAIDTALSTIDAYVDTLETNIGTPAAIDGGAATIAGMLRKLFDDGSGFDATTDSLNALRAAIDAKPTYPTSFAGSKATAALSASGAETLEFSTTEGVLTNNATLLQLKITVSGATSDSTVQIFEKTGNPAGNLVYEVQNIDSTGINLALPSMIFRNADDTATNKIYVKISNVTDAGSSTFTVELRGLLNSN